MIELISVDELLESVDMIEFRDHFIEFDLLFENLNLYPARISFDSYQENIKGIFTPLLVINKHITHYSIVHWFTSRKVCYVGKRILNTRDKTETLNFLDETLKLINQELGRDIT